ncbi:NAD(P)-dependent oxidoreductase [Prauserella muralis]|uniref:3-hydroxyisobutyrate dehydrogenase n=1 Tax=Prauserella muralis TaxID=588067 RepID=A0A2V4ATP6_9PSEU|nr:NAD(P)-dependent oxidoreductase [Prauserella muralis]PXY24658.1 3-hydroxyisobutyrate dehydrogenase [Prauserella muralis]TWE27652.1 3-hydroxyisobutyrate dehydrogenase [Prauserella muralis]
MNVGFIGLGHMGGPMALNILRAGIPLVVHDRDGHAAERHVALGATWAATPAEAAARADVLITMLPGPRQVADVLLGAGAADALPAGAVWLDMSTSTPAAAHAPGERIAARGAHRMDAPVSGMARGAADGTLQIFAGGDAAVFERCLPLLRILGDPERIFLVGGHGAGYTVKLMVNLLWFAHLVAAAEVLTLGVKVGVDLGVLRRSLVASPANSNVVEHDLVGIIERGDYDESFAMALACKDLGLAVDVSREAGVPVELSALVEQIYRRAKTTYGDLAGEMIPVRLYEDLAGVNLRAAVGG